MAGVSPRAVSPRLPGTAPVVPGPGVGSRPEEVVRRAYIGAKFGPTRSLEQTREHR